MYVLQIFLCMYVCIWITHGAVTKRVDSIHLEALNVRNRDGDVRDLLQLTLQQMRHGAVAKRAEQ